MKQWNLYAISGFLCIRGKVAYIFIFTFNRVCIPSEPLS